MKLTEQQALVLFDIAKTTMNSGGFSNYSKEEIMKLLNQIISQQDNSKIINLLKEKSSEKPDDIDDIDDFWN